MLRHPPTSPLFPYTTLFRSFAAFAATPVMVPPFSANLPVPSSFSDATSTLNCDVPSTTMPSDPVPLLLSSLSLRSEEHTSELQSLRHLVCRLLLEKKNVPHE